MRNNQLKSLLFKLYFPKETVQIQKRHEINRTYGLSRSNSFVSEIPDEEFKVFMAIARYCIRVLTHVSTPLIIRNGSTYIIDGKLV